MRYRGVIISLVLLSFTHVCAAQDPGIVDDKSAALQRAANHSRGIENFITEMAQNEQQLLTMIESTDWLMTTYDAARFVGGSEQLMELLDQISAYKYLVDDFRSDLIRYAESGALSFDQLRYSMSLVNRGISEVTGTLTGHIRTALTAPGLTVGQRMKILVGTADKLKKEYWVLLWQKTVNSSKAKAVERSADRIEAVSSFGVQPVETLSDDGLVIERPAVSTVSSSVSSICSEAIARRDRYYGSGNIVKNTASSGRTVYGSAIDIASVLVGILGSLFLVMAIARRSRGEMQSQDVLYKIGIGLMFALIALQCVSRYFLF